PAVPAHDGELVGERDVHIPENVLVELRQFGNLRGRDLVHPGNDLPVQGGRESGAGRSDTAYHFGNVLDFEGWVPRVDAFRGERQEEILADSGSVRLEQRQEQLLGGPGVGGRLQNDQLARAEARRSLLTGGDH